MKLWFNLFFINLFSKLNFKNSVTALFNQSRKLCHCAFHLFIKMISTPHVSLQQVFAYNPCTSKLIFYSNCISINFLYIQVWNARKNIVNFYFLGSLSGLPFLTAYIFFPYPDASLLPTVALKMNEAFSTKSLVTSSADLVFMAFVKSVTYNAGYSSYIILIILSLSSFILMHVNDIFLSLNSLIKSSSISPSGHLLG